MNQRKIPVMATGLLLISVLAAACAAPGTNTQNNAGQAGAQQRVTVRQGTIDNRIVATGQVVARTNASLSFTHSGPVKSLLVKEGDVVKAGQPLATLDTTDLELTAKQQLASYVSAQAAYSQTVKPPADADLQAAQAAVLSTQEAYSQSLKGGTSADYASAYAAVKSAQAALDDLNNPPTANDVASQQAALLNAQADLQQKQAAYNTAYQRNPAGIGGTGESMALQQATNNYNAAKAAYDKLFEKPTAKAIEAAKAQLVQAQANLANLAPTKEKVSAAAQTLAQAQSKLEALTPVPETIAQAKAKLDQAYAAWQQADKAVKDATLLAPYDGLVTTINFDIGDWVNAGAAAVLLADFTVPQFEVNVDEADLGNVKVGDDATVLLQTYPNMPIPAKVETVAAAGTTTGNIITFKVKLGLGKVITGEQPNILIGMSGTSQVVTARADNALLVPNNALIVDSQTKGYSVERLTPSGVPEQVPVKIGFRGATNVQILSGVNAGDVLVIPSAGASNSTGGPGGGPGGPFGGR